jgi:DNA-binding IscR family transcriptional regulator
MKRDSRLSSTLHAILHMAMHDAPMTSAALASCMQTNPVVVRRTMAGLREAGIVRSEKGHGGGWTIARDLSAVTLRDIHEALGSPPLLSARLHLEQPDCLVEQAVNQRLISAFQEAEALLVGRLGSITLAALADDFRGGLSNCKGKKDTNDL